MRSNIYILFGFLAGIAVVCIAVFTVIVATSHAVSPSDFPRYAYSDYIDRTSSMTFTADGGAQLYEAEKAALENAKAEHNVLASGESAVGGMEEGSVIRYTVVSDSVCTVRLFLSLCYSPASGSDAAADQVLSVRCNGAETGIRSASVYACGSPYDFRENGLCAAELKKGENEIEVRVKTGGVTADYMLLVPEQLRTSSDPVIGNPSEPFDSSGGEQRFESESAKNENVVAFYDPAVSGGYFIRFYADGACAAFYPLSDKGCIATLNISLRSTGSSARLSDLCSLYVNGMETVMYPSGTGSSDKFGLLYAADIALGKGENEILIVKRNGVFDVDYIELSPVPETERCNRHDLPPKQCRKGIGALLYRGGAFRAYAACLSHE